MSILDQLSEKDAALIGAGIERGLKGLGDSIADALKQLPGKRIKIEITIGPEEETSES